MSGKEDKPMQQFKSLDEVLKSDKSHRLAHAANVVLGPPPSEDPWNLSLISGGMEEDEPDYVQMLAICNSNTRPGDFTSPTVEPSTEDQLDTDGIDPFHGDGLPFPPEIMATMDTSWHVQRETAIVEAEFTEVSETPQKSPESIPRSVPEATPAPKGRTDLARHVTFQTADYGDKQRQVATALYAPAARNQVNDFQKKFRVYKPESKTEFEGKAIHIESGDIVELAHAIRVSEMPRFINSVPALDWMLQAIKYEEGGIKPVIGTVIQPWNESRVVSDGLFERVNEWRPSGIVPRKGDTDALQTVILRACNDDKELAHHITQQIGYSLRNQGKSTRMIAGLIFLGGYGTGKSTLIEILKRLFGSRNVADVEPQHVQEKYSGFVEGKTALILEDVDRFSRTTYNSMKRFHTDSELPLRKMRRDVVSTPNHLELILVSCNYFHDVYLPKKDRRYTVCNNEIGPCDDWVYADLKDDPDLSYTNGNGLSYALDYFLDYDLSGFNPAKSAFDTEAKQTIQYNDTTGDILAIKDLLEEWEHQGYGQFFASTIRRSIKLSPRYNAMRYLYADLESLGCKRIKQTSDRQVRDYIYQIGRRGSKTRIVPEEGLGRNLTDI